MLLATVLPFTASGAPSRANKNFDKFAAHEAFCLNGSDGILLDYFPSRTFHGHNYSHLFVRSRWQLDLLDGSFVDSTDSNVRAIVQACNVLDSALT